MVARLLWEQDVAGSNPVTPTGISQFRLPACEMNCEKVCRVSAALGRSRCRRPEQTHEPCAAKGSTRSFGHPLWRKVAAAKQLGESPDTAASCLALGFRWNSAEQLRTARAGFPAEAVSGGHPHAATAGRWPATDSHRCPARVLMGTCELGMDSRGCGGHHTRCLGGLEGQFGEIVNPDGVAGAWGFWRSEGLELW